MNQSHFLGTRQSVAVAFALCSLIQVPAIAQVPTDGQFPAAQPQVGQFSTEQSIVVPPNYILGPGDQIQIDVFGYEEFTGAKVVLPDGTVSLPVIGTVEAADRTPGVLAQELTTRLNAYLVDPVVTVSLNTLRPVLVNVAGEVQRPGPIQLRSLTTTTVSSSGGTTRASLEGVPTVSSALMEAGGVTRDADIRQVVLRRYSPNGNSPTITINLWDALLSESSSRDLVLQDGDSIFVPKLTADSGIDRRLIARSSLAPATVRVRVVGEVTRPGEVQVPPNSSLSSAVAIAGGPTEDAKLSEVAYVRINEAGAVVRENVDLRNLTDNYQIQDGDVIIVPETNSSSGLRLAGRLLGPLNFLRSLFGF